MTTVLQGLRRLNVYATVLHALQEVGIRPLNNFVDNTLIKLSNTIVFNFCLVRFA